jgi:LeuA allosteric (dimerisation) domain
MALSSEMTPDIVQLKEDGIIRGQSIRNGNIAPNGVISLVSQLLNINEDFELSSLLNFQLKSIGSGSNAIGQGTAIADSRGFQSIATASDCDIGFAGLHTCLDAHYLSRLRGERKRQFELKSEDQWATHIFAYNNEQKAKKIMLRNSSCRKYRLVDYDLESLEGSGASAKITLYHPDKGRISDLQNGNGAVDAGCKAINQMIFGQSDHLKLLDLSITALGTGNSATGLSVVSVQDNLGQIFEGQARDRNIVIATQKAYIDATNYCNYYRNILCTE